MSNHTPAPWRWLEEGRHEDLEGPWTICGPEHDDLADVYSTDNATVGMSRAEGIANARLIAAAPTLLAALEGLVAWKGAVAVTEPELGGLVRAFDKAEAAIARARGENET